VGELFMKTVKPGFSCNKDQQEGFKRELMSRWRKKYAGSSGIGVENIASLKYRRKTPIREG
jgi:hypothetical protein